MEGRKEEKRGRKKGQGSGSKREERTSERKSGQGEKKSKIDGPYHFPRF